MRTLVTGAGGLLAAAVRREFAGAGEVVALTRAELDVTDSAAVERVLLDARPDVVINCAAFNDVDGAERDPAAALRVNAFAVWFLAAAARTAGAAFVHYSTDFVFDGTSNRPYVEGDAPNPQSAYGASKLVGELFALEHPRGYVLRVESLFGDASPGAARRGSLSAIVTRIRGGDAVPLFTDRTVSPSYTVDVAGATRLLIERRAPPGLYHCVNSGAASWAEIGAEAARVLGLPLRMTPITLDTAKLQAPRPRYCALSNVKLAEQGIRMPTWQNALARHLL